MRLPASPSPGSSAPQAPLDAVADEPPLWPASYPEQRADLWVRSRAGQRAPWAGSRTAGPGSRSAPSCSPSGRAR